MDHCFYEKMCLSGEVEMQAIDFLNVMPDPEGFTEKGCVQNW